MSKVASKNQSSKKPTTKQLTSSTKAPAQTSDLAAAAFAEAVEGLGVLIEQTNTSETSSEKFCLDTSDYIIKSLTAQLEKSDISDEQRIHLLNAIRAEREYLFNKDSEIRENNNKRMKMFLNFILNSLVTVCGFVLMKEALPLIKEAILSNKKT